LRLSRAIRATAWAVVAAGIAAPAVRRRRRLHPALVLGTAAAAPVALCVAVRRSRRRDVGTCLLQMWAYVAAYEMPHDDPEALEARVRVAYPVRVDRALGLGTLPTLRLQRALSTPGSFSPHEKVLVWAHWLWFLVPHSALAYILVRRRERFARAAVSTYAVFDVGAAVYWILPTAPPWYAARQGLTEDGRTPQLRRMMVEYGEQFWGRGWGPLYDVLGGNPLAAMPSLHFATSVMAAHLLSEAGPLEGAVGWSYALTLGVALVYLGEHYVVDLLAGLALTEAVRRQGPRFAPALRGVSRAVQALESRARARG
jgi:membrane-associated phospholipid phosphatase